jgi:hypothetical protein
MRKFFFSFLILSVTANSFAQKKVNFSLKHELDSLFKRDQEFRNLISSDLIQTKTDSLAVVYKVPKDGLIQYIINIIPTIDSTNLIRVEEIIKQYGYPGKSLVGTETNEAAFFIIQHSKSIDKFLPVVKKAVDKNELSYKLYAMMQDRSLMYNGKEQIYGTQGKGIQYINSETGKKEFMMIIWPVQDPANVNSRRKKAGFKTTIEEYSKQELGIDYKVFTLNEVKTLEQSN